MDDLVRRLRLLIPRYGNLCGDIGSEAADEIERLTAEQRANSALKAQYLGVCALLGRVSGRRLDEETNDIVKRALEDCCVMYPNLEVWNTSDGGSSLEPKEQA